MGLARAGLKKLVYLHRLEDESTFPDEEGEALESLDSSLIL